MSTSCVINFCSGERICAKIYRHSDGYSESVIPDLTEFFKTIQKHTQDTRFDNPTFLSAKFVVWCALRKILLNISPLDSFGIGICQEDPGNITYTYFVDCDKFAVNGFPTVTYKTIHCKL